MQRKSEKVLLTRRLHGRFVSRPVYNDANVKILDGGVQLHEVMIQGLKKQGILEIDVYAEPLQVNASV